MAGESAHNNIIEHLYITMPDVLSSVYAAGLADEKLVKSFLRSKGLIVTEPTQHQDRFEDTDAFINGVPISIKAEHSGLKYGNICFELAQHLTEFQDCPQSKAILNTKDLTLDHLDHLITTGSWETSWYQRGKAVLYYIYQGDELHIYKKADIVAHVASHGWLRLRPLTKMRSSYLGGDYRYCNAICAYLDTNAVPHISYRLVKQAKQNLEKTYK